MLKCEVCQRSRRDASIVSKKIICMYCLDQLIQGLKLRVRVPGEVYVQMNEDRELIDLPNPNPGSIPQVAVKPKPESKAKKSTKSKVVEGK